MVSGEHQEIGRYFFSRPIEDTPVWEREEKTFEDWWEEISTDTQRKELFVHYHRGVYLDHFFALDHKL